jgi:transposase, IS30 family
LTGREVSMREGIGRYGDRLMRAEELELLDRIADGETRPVIAGDLGTTERTVGGVLARAGGRPSRRSRRRQRSPRRLSLLEREEIRAGIAARRLATARKESPEMVSISERPAAAGERAVPGPWEGDLLVGKANRSLIGTLVERQTRFVILAHLGTDASTENVTAGIAEQILRLPQQPRRSLTWDQGREMARHREFTVATAVRVYLCDPHSPWQRGSNENTNGLLRQYFPKGMDLAARDQATLDRVAAELNRRPRQTLEWLTPAEKMTEPLR